MELQIKYDSYDAKAKFLVRYDADSSLDEVASCSDKNFTAEFNKINFAVDHSIMPPAVRHISKDRSIIVFERPPGYCTFYYSNEAQQNLNADRQSNQHYRLPLPWQRYVLVVSPEGRLINIFLYFGHDQLRSLNFDRLYLAPLHNFYLSGRLCMASFTTLPDIEPTIFGAINGAYNMIWGSGYNADTNQAQANLTRTVKLTNNPLANVGTVTDPNRYYERWSRASLEDVMYWGWTPSWDSINTLLEHKDEIYHDATSTASHDILVKMMFAAQDAV